VNRSDRKLWASARTLDDLCELTAANRAGFLTDGSQPGRGGVLQSGPLTREGCQRAAVSGYAAADVLARLRSAAVGTGLIFEAHLAARRRTSYRHAVVVTLDAGKPFTWFGATLSRSDLSFEYETCHKDARNAVREAWQVTIIDPVYGRNDVLWPALAELAELEVARS
jgi:hypothetical protein